MIDRALVLAARQGGVVRREDLLSMGITSRMIEVRVRNGTWESVQEGVYRLLRLPAWRDRLAAAVHGLPSAVASHQSAAILHGFPVNKDKPLVVTVESRTTHEWPATTVHRVGDLSPSDIGTRDRLRLTTPGRTAFDLAAILSEEQFIDMADSLAATGVVPTTTLHRVAERLCRRGKPGSAAVRRYLEDRAGVGAVSPLERRGVDILTSMDIPAFVREYEIPWSPGHRFDIAFPDHRLAIEWDSHQWHSSAERFQADRDRDREAILRGWRVLRFTWDDVVNRPDQVIATIIAALDLLGTESTG